MWNERRKRFKSAVLLLVAIFSLNNAQQPMNIENFMVYQPMQKEGDSHYHEMVKYIADLFCTNSTYRFNHIYVERSLSTSLADELINHINNCMTAGVLISRYSNSFS